MHTGGGHNIFYIGDMVPRIRLMCQLYYIYVTGAVLRDSCNSPVKEERPNVGEFAFFLVPSATSVGVNAVIHKLPYFDYMYFTVTLFAMVHLISSQ